jgi:hypothetical protein
MLSRVLGLLSVSCCLLAGIGAVDAQNSGYNSNYMGAGSGCVAGGTCYYVDSVGGSDTNTGMSKTAAWANAPGMPCAKGNAAAHSFSQRDEIILKGGDAWPYSCADPWTISGGNMGTPNNYAYQGLYVGYDPTWNNGTVNSVRVTDPGVCAPGTNLSVSLSGGGGAGAAAAANLETDPSAAGDLEFVTVTSGGSGYSSDPTVTFNVTSGSCSKFPSAYADIYSPIITGAAGTYGTATTMPPMMILKTVGLTIDHLDVGHMHFYDGAPNCTYSAGLSPNTIASLGNYQILQNLFVHDFRPVDAASSCLVGALDGAQTAAISSTANVGSDLHNNVINNYESEAVGCANGYGGSCASTTGVFNMRSATNNIINAWRGGLYTTGAGSNWVVAGNKMWAIMNDAGSQHPDAFYLMAGGLVYNNLLRDIYAGSAAFYLEDGGGQSPMVQGNIYYIFNNVAWNVGTSTPPFGISSEFVSANAIGVSPSVAVTFANNTLYAYQGTYDCVNAGQWFGASAALSLSPGFNYNLYNNQCISTQTTVHWFDSNGSAAICNSSPNGCGIWNGLEGPNSTATHKAIDPLNVIDTPNNAASQGYAATNNYSPRASANDTVVFSGNPNSHNLTSLCFTSLNGLSLSALCFDINGNPRPATGGWQAGAYQLSGGLVPQLPSNVVVTPIVK